MEFNTNYELFNEDHSNFHLFANDYGEINKPTSSKISMLTEDQSTENFLKEFDCFYTEMMSKVNGIRNTPVISNVPFPDDTDIDEEKLFRNLKDTPEVREQLEFIKKLDGEIDSVISQYKIEKEERLQTQYEMYNEITKNEVTERDADLFLNLCRFEFTETNKEETEKVPDRNERKKRDYIPEENKNNSFIIRNVHLAFSNSSLTDEEKCNLEQLIQLDDNSEPCSNPFNTLSNRDEDIRQLKDIDEELKKIQLDQENTEKNMKDDESESLVEEIERLNDFMLEQRLKRLESKLKILHEIEDKDEQNEKDNNIERDEDEPTKLTISECDLDKDVENSTNSQDEDGLQRIIDDDSEDTK